MQGGASRLVNNLQHLQRIGGQGCRKASLRALTAETAGAISPQFREEPRIENFSVLF